MCAVCTMCADNASPATQHTCAIICKLVHRFANVILSSKARNTTARSTVRLDAFYDLQKKGAERRSFLLSILIFSCCGVDSQNTSSCLATIFMLSKESINRLIYLRKIQIFRRVAHMLFASRSFPFVNSKDSLFVTQAYLKC